MAITGYGQWLACFRLADQKDDLRSYIRCGVLSQEEQDEALLEALETRRADDIKTLTEMGARGSSVLASIFCARCFLYAVQIANGPLLRAVTPLAIRSNYLHANNEKALRVAARMGDVEAVRALVKAGARINAYERADRRMMTAEERSQSYSALTYAARNGDCPMLTELLNSGADIQMDNHAALIAAKYNPAATRLLLSRYPTDFDKSIIEALVYHQRFMEAPPEVRAILIEYLGHTLDKSFFYSSIHPEHVYQTVMNVLKRFGPSSPEFAALSDDDKDLAFLAAVRKRRPQDVQRFLQAGIEASNCYLWKAARRGDIPVLDELLDHCNIHAEYDRAMRMAARTGHLGTLGFLYEQGADLNAFVPGNRSQMTEEEKEMSYTALTYAARNNDLEMAEDLLAADADVHADSDEALFHVRSFLMMNLLLKRFSPETIREYARQGKFASVPGEVMVALTQYLSRV